MPRIKEITEPWITARHMKQDYYTFATIHALAVSCNHDPSVTETDRGSRRRLMGIRWPFTYHKPDEYEELRQAGLLTGFDRLGRPSFREQVLSDRDVHIAMLAWLAEGARKWYEDRDALFRVPKKVAEETRKWLDSSSPIAQWASEFLTPDPAAHVMTNEVIVQFNSYLEVNNHPAWTSQTTAKRLEEFAEAAFRVRIEKRKTKRSDKLSRPETWPHRTWQDSPPSYQAWHGLRFKNSAERDEEAPYTTPDEDNLPASIPEVPGLEVAEYMGANYSVNTLAGTSGTVYSSSPLGRHFSPAEARGTAVTFQQILDHQGLE